MTQSQRQRLTRKIVHIDEEKCDGCGNCVPSCAEGAIRIVNGKARLVAENLCDGLGACLGECPQGAITVEERPADEFDPAAVEAEKMRLESSQRAREAAAKARPYPWGRTSTPIPAGTSPRHGGCPGNMTRLLPVHEAPKGPPTMKAPSPAASAERTSKLSHWPVQLTLVPPTGRIWDKADVLLAADCVPFAMSDFHEKMLAGKTLAIACPKLDSVEPYIEKLAHIFSTNDIRSVTVAHMEVPCCFGLVRLVQAAMARASRQDIPFHDVTVRVDGTVELV
jgi:NAD-dependent dihydropyrimidine dehydrogenase PreA subunit